MEKKTKTRPLLLLILSFYLVLAAMFRGCSSAASQTPTHKKSPLKGGSSSSAAVFPVTGNVYPLGYYSVSLKIGNPPKVFDLDIDTGSDLTWVQCDAPCNGCTKPRESLYKPRNNVLPCSHSLCQTIESPDKQCDRPNEQCDYEISYADQGSSLGVLVVDYFPLRLLNGSIARPSLAFGCGYDQKTPSPIAPPQTSGVLGLGNSKASVISQLNSLGLTNNVFGHCLSGRGGFLFFGDYLVPSSRVSWTPMLHTSLGKHYSAGPAELLFDGKRTDIKGLEFLFDSGSSYTYFSTQVYQTILNLVKKDLNGKLKDAPDEKALPICWKGAKPFKSLRDVKTFFKPLTLSFTKAKNAQLQLLPENYLIVTDKGNVCLGILNGTEVGLRNYNVIGDIFLQDKLVVYDNEKMQIGWTSADCDRLPNVDCSYVEGFCQPYAAKYGILEEKCPAVFAI